MRILVDVDNTLYDAHRLFVEIGQNCYGITLPMDSNNWHDYTEIADRSTLHSIFRKAHSREYVMKQTPYRNAAGTLEWISDKNHDIFFVSDRHKQSVGALRDWLALWGFPVGDFPYKNVIVTKDKRSWMEEVKPEIVIDDRVRTMFYAREWDATILALECPWNINLKGEVEGIYIYKDWNEIARHLDQLL